MTGAAPVVAYDGVALNDGVAPQRRRTEVRLTWLGVCVTTLFLFVILSLVLGARDVGFSDIIAALTGKSESIGQAAVMKRVPRTMLAIIVGASLAISGATIQAITRNPLADPGILGVSSGAALAVVIGIAFFGLSDPYSYLVIAVAGALVAFVLVYAVGSLGRGGATPLKLALAGAAISAAFSSLITAILLPRLDVMVTFRFWEIGGVGGATWEKITLSLPFIAVGMLLCLANTRSLNSLAFGDNVAAGLGVNIRRTRLVSAAGAVLLCGVSTSMAGPIAFVGLVVPHVCRLLVGSDYRWLLPFSGLVGAALIVIADVVGRVIARPGEIEVGIITALIGAPVLVWVASRERMRQL